jgi:hypothetical protein
MPTTKTAHPMRRISAAILLTQRATAIMSGDHSKSFFADANQHAKHDASRRYAQRSPGVKLAPPGHFLRYWVEQSLALPQAFMADC